MCILMYLIIFFYICTDNRQNSSRAQCREGSNYADVHLQIVQKTAKLPSPLVIPKTEVNPLAYEELTAASDEVKRETSDQGRSTFLSL